MAPISTDDQVKFLISCIRYSDHGKINWENVAEDCGIVSKAAASKRYERLLKANGISSNGKIAAGDSSTPDAKATPATEQTPKKAKAQRPKTTRKKRKLDEVVEAEETEDTPIQGEHEASLPACWLET